MHKIPKLTLGLGGILFVIGWAIIMMDPMGVDSSSPSSEDWSGTLMFEDETPTTFEGEFKWSATYNVFVQDGSTVTVEVLNSDIDDIFWPCDVDGECDEFDVDGHIDGYHYIGELDFEEEGTGIYNPFSKSGTYEISFTEENGETVNVMIREDTSFEGFLVFVGGVISCFAGIIILIIGSILAKLIKENRKVELSSTMSDEPRVSNSEISKSEIGLIKSGLEEVGWKNVQPANHMDIEFDLVGDRRFTLTKWNVLVKVLPVLDDTTANIWKENFEVLNKNSKSLIWGQCFLLCLLVEDVSTEVSESLSADNFGLFGMFRLKGGGGNVLVGDMKNGEVYGNVPSLPYDVHKFSQNAKEIIIQTFKR